MLEQFYAKPDSRMHRVILAKGRSTAANARRNGANARRRVPALLPFNLGPTRGVKCCSAGYNKFLAVLEEGEVEEEDRLILQGVETVQRGENEQSVIVMRAFF